MRVLIAGWHGQVANALVAAAAARPEIAALAIGRPALDLCRPATVATALADGKPDVIINTAAYTAVDQAEAEPDMAHRLNCEGAEMIAREAARKSAAIIHLSTDYVFDGTLDRPYRPDDPTNPISVYGRTKLAGEHAVAAANPRHLIVRTSWVYSGVGRNFAKTMLEQARTKARVEVVSDQFGTPTYAPHLAEALVEMAIRAREEPQDSTLWGVYHASGGGETNWAAFAEALFTLSRQAGGPTAEVVPIFSNAYPTAAARPRNARLDCGKLAETFGVTLPAWQVGAEACVAAIVSRSER